MFRFFRSIAAVLALLLILLLGLGPPTLADPDPNRVKFDTSDKPASIAVWLTFTSASDDTFDFGSEFCFGSVQQVSADSVGIEYLGRTGELIDSGPFWSGRPDENPRAGAPRIDWPLVTVGDVPFDFCCGGGGAVRYKGLGQAGKFLLLLTKRCP
jgi:hypothetical protein